MPLRRLTAPASLPLALAAVKAHLRVDHDADDAALLDMIGAATDLFDGDHGRLGRALVTQSWRLLLPAFPAGPIALPLPPLQEVVAVRYRDRSGGVVTMDLQTLIVAGIGTDDPTVRPMAGTNWPATADHPEAVEVDFRAGYGDTGADVPGPIRAAILELVADRYAFRESVSVGSPFAILPTSAQAAADYFRVRWAV